MKTKLEARLVAVTTPLIELRVPDAEGLIAFCARVSNPQHQDKELGTLLDYCIKNKHWSVFEMANAVVEVEAPRDISRQLLRHRSFSFQEFSQRYSDQIEFTEREFRRQDVKNRQNSTDDLDHNTVEFAESCGEAVAYCAEDDYRKLVAKGVAKECARALLPEGLTMSRLYVSGSLRSWITYLQVRLDKTTQLEHRVLAEKIKDCLEPAFPTVFKTLSDSFEDLSYG